MKMYVVLDTRLSKPGSIIGRFGAFETLDEATAFAIRYVEGLYGTDIMVNATSSSSKKYYYHYDGVDHEIEITKIPIKNTDYRKRLGTW